MVSKSWSLSSSLPLISACLDFKLLNSCSCTISVVYLVSSVSCTKTKVHVRQKTHTVFVHKFLDLPIMDIQQWLTDRFFIGEQKESRKTRNFSFGQ